jgi:tetratricopeptide (TPR) repeat protein
LSPGEADGHKVLAEIALQQRQHGGEPKALDDALRELAAAAAAQPSDAWVWSTWIRTLAGEGRAPEAASVARRAAGVPGLDPAAPWITLARVLLARGDSTEAAAILEGANVPGRGAGPILEMLADLKGNNGDLAGRAAALVKLRELRADDPELAHRLGAVRLELGDFYGAVAPLEEAFAARESDPVVRRDLARALVRLGRGAEAVKLLRALPPAYQTPHTLLLWAQAAELAGDFAESADRLEQLLDKLSDTDLKSYGPSIRLQAAQTRLRTGKPEQALALIRGQDDDPAALRFVDANQDGRNDLMLFVRYAAPRVFLQTADGKFEAFSGSETRASLLKETTPEGAAFVDVTGDGKADIVLAQGNLARALKTDLTAADRERLQAFVNALPAAHSDESPM